MFIYPKSTLRILHMLMHLTSDHVTLLLEEFQPPKLSPSWAEGAGQTHIGLCPKFLVFFVSYCVIVHQMSQNRKNVTTSLLFAGLRLQTEAQ